MSENRQKPKVFIGSSHEKGLPVARVLQNLLDDGSTCEPTIWDQGSFRPGQVIIEVLEKETRDKDFAVLVLTQDDMVASIQDNKEVMYRDNIYLEFGLFMGALGRERTFLVCDRKLKNRLPSDLDGYTFVPYTPPDDGDIEKLPAHLGSASNKIRKSISEQGVRQNAQSPTKESLSPKQEALKKFWQLDIPDVVGFTPRAIIYPSVDREFMRKQGVDDLDRLLSTRLEPFIAFEHHKALQLIEQTLLLSGFSDGTFSHSYSVEEMHDDEVHKHCIWICFSRNDGAKQRFMQYEHISRFRFEEAADGTQQIKWLPKDQKEPITVQSPLGKCLERQRTGELLGYKPKRHNAVIAKDFAILARFSKPENSRLKDFFIAGIRGLGTWGAAWFLDQRWEQLAKLCDEQKDDVQLLLEVTYKNGIIQNVRNVSDDLKEDFLVENELENIDKWIKRHH